MKKYLKWRGILKPTKVEWCQKILSWLPVLLLYHVVAIEILGKVVENTCSKVKLKHHSNTLGLHVAENFSIKACVARDGRLTLKPLQHLSYDLSSVWCLLRSGARGSQTGRKYKILYFFNLVSDLEVYVFECFHNSWVKLIYNLCQFLLPELIGILLTDCDWIIIGCLKYTNQILHLHLL